MKENEITSRQNRVVYLLLLIVGAIALSWTLWRHTHAPANAGPASAIAAPAATSAEQPK